jgi:hypothetical protein
MNMSARNTESRQPGTFLVTKGDALGRVPVAIVWHTDQLLSLICVFLEPYRKRGQKNDLNIEH